MGRALSWDETIYNFGLSLGDIIEREGTASRNLHQLQMDCELFVLFELRV